MRLSKACRVSASGCSNTRKEETRREVSYDQVREARAAGQEAMLRVVAKVLGEFPGSAADEVQVRQTLLAPVMSQNRRIAEAFSRKRPVADGDPETGEEEPEPEPPTEVSPSTGGG